MAQEFPIEWMDAGEMMAHPQNFRRHPQSQVTHVKRSLDRFGWLENVVWNRRTGYILSGHARIEIAAKKGEAVPVRPVDVSMEVEKQILLALGKTSEGATVDEEALTNLLRELVSESDEMPIGVSQSELERLLADAGGEPEEEEDYPETPGVTEEMPADIPLASIRMVQLFLTQENITTWNGWISGLAKEYGTETVTDTVLRAVEESYARNCDTEDPALQPVA